MAHPRNRLPENTSLVMPRLMCEDAAGEMEFCLRTFEAEELNRRLGPDGKVAHGLLKISGEMIMIEGIWPSLPSRARAGCQFTGRDLRLCRRCRRDGSIAVANGARILVPLQDQFWGDRIAWFIDPAGHVWTVASRIEDTSAAERTAPWDNILKEGR